MKRNLFKIIIFIFVFMITEVFSLQARDLTPQAKQIYKKYYPAIVQVRVISRSSGEKSSLGSGFFFTKDGLVASNYHVVSDAVNYPALYYIEFLTFDGQKGKLEILNIDPIHDLAILRADKTSKEYLTLGNSELSKGAKIFSFGNPYDLGMIIIEGLFNGLLEHSRYRKILFSGSLNPGMSGGPAILSNGLVFGVNVSSAGNDISFFVPVEYLKDLHKEIEDNQGKSVGHNWKAVIRKRLVLEQESFLNKLLTKKEWDKREVGIAAVPGEISSEFKCWGSSGDNEKHWIKDEYLNCSTEDNLFISSTLRTGTIYFQYEWYASRSNDPVRLYNLYEKYASNREFTFRNAQERDVENFACDQEFVKIGKHTCKVEFCARPYKYFSGIFDMSFQITTTDMKTDGFVINGIMLGFSELHGKNFLRRFLNEIEWRK